MTNISLPKETYNPPSTRVMDLDLSSVICGSPRDGENEDIGFDDWGD